MPLHKRSYLTRRDSYFKLLATRRDRRIQNPFRKTWIVITGGVPFLGTNHIQEEHAMSIIGYARVSTREQNPESQAAALRAAGRSGSIQITANPAGSVTVHNGLSAKSIYATETPLSFEDWIVSPAARRWPCR